MSLCRVLWKSKIREYKTAAVHQAAAETLTFPREGAAVNYAINWALAAKGVIPQGEVFRNVEDPGLQQHGATTQEPESGSKVFARGSFAFSGASDVTNSQFGKLLKEVTRYLSSSRKLFVRDGALGSSLRFPIKVRSISDTSSASSLLGSILCPTSLRDVSPEKYPLSIYVASGESLKVLENLVDASSFIAADFDRSVIIIGGKAFADLSGMKSTLGVAVTPTFLSRGALPLRARVLSLGDSTVLVAAPEEAFREPSTLSDAEIVWDDDGVSSVFNRTKTKLPVSMKHPTAFVVVTMDRTGAVPEIAKLSPGQAAFHYLAGYNGESFTPGYNKCSPAVNPLSIAKELPAMLTKTSTASYLVNANGLSGDDVAKLLEAASAGKLPKNKKSSEESMRALKNKYADFMSKAFPDLPESIRID